MRSAATGIAGRCGSRPTPTDGSAGHCRSADRPAALRWLRSHSGDLAILWRRKHDVSLPDHAFDGFPPAPLRFAGAASLARLEDDDRVVPWVLRAGPPTCRAIALAAALVPPEPGDAVDCFDLKTGAGMVLTQLAVRVTQGLDQADVPLTTLAALEHGLQIVPHLRLGAARPGFGFLDGVRLRVTGTVPPLEAVEPFELRLLE
jgi:hypothetical protein